MTKQLEALISRAKHIVENGGLLARDTSLALIAALEQSQASATRLRVERDALREQELHKATNTRAAADIYFQLIEECEIPPGGSLVQHVDSLKERIAELEAEIELAKRCLPYYKDDKFSVAGSWVGSVQNYISHLEASKLAVKLPTQEKYDDPLSAYEAIKDCAEAIRAAGITVQGEE